MNQRFTSISSELGNFMVVCSYVAKTNVITVFAGNSDSFIKKRYKWHVVGDLSFKQALSVARLDLNSPIKKRFIRIQIEGVLCEAFSSISTSFELSVLRSLVDGVLEDACFSKSNNLYEHYVGNAVVVCR